nr:hypothetical protein [Tanacetum cinerariifolium]
MGLPSLDDYEYYPKSNYYAKPPIKGRENQHRRSFACLEQSGHLEQTKSQVALQHLLFPPQLKKVLIAEEKEDDSFARTSYVSNGRSSHGCTITLSRKPLEVVAVETENGSVACPLQGFLLSSTVGQPETTGGKKEPRTSLGDLF